MTQVVLVQDQSSPCDLGVSVSFAFFDVKEADQEGSRGGLAWNTFQASVTSSSSALAEVTQFRTLVSDVCCLTGEAVGLATTKYFKISRICQWHKFSFLI